MTVINIRKCDDLEKAVDLFKRLYYDDKIQEAALMYVDDEGKVRTFWSVTNPLTAMGMCEYAKSLMDEAVERE